MPHNYFKRCTIPTIKKAQILCLTNKTTTPKLKNLYYAFELDLPKQIFMKNYIVFFFLKNFINNVYDSERF